MASFQLRNLPASGTTTAAQQMSRRGLCPLLPSTPTPRGKVCAHALPLGPSSRNLVVRRFREQHGPSRTIDEITSTKGFTDQSSTRHGPVVVSVDNTAEGATALKWALKNLCAPAEDGEQLELVHVVCDPMAMSAGLSVGSSAGGRAQMVEQTDFISPDYVSKLISRAYDSLMSRCGKDLEKCGVPYQVHLPRLTTPRSAATIGEKLLEEAERLGARALVVASHGPGAMVDYGSVARYCYQHAALPLILIPGKSDVYFGTHSFDLMSGSYTPSPARGASAADEEEQLETISHAAPATQAHVPARQDQAPAKPQEPAAASKGFREVLLVVSHLPELESHWQWVADNLCRHGDVLNIWHVNMVGPDTPAVKPGADGNLASLPTALAQVLKARGLADVKYSCHYYPDDPARVAKEVVAAVEGCDHPRMVCMLNYSRQSMLKEALKGSVASELARHCPVPLVLLQPAM